MLRELLHQIGTRNYTAEELAEKMQVDMATLRSRLAYLEQCGYLRKSSLSDENACNGHSCGDCRGCPMKEANKTDFVIWERRSGPAE